MSFDITLNDNIHIRTDVESCNKVVVHVERSKTKKYFEFIVPIGVEWLQLCVDSASFNFRAWNSPNVKISVYCATTKTYKKKCEWFEITKKRDRTLCHHSYAKKWQLVANKVSIDHLQL